MNDLPQMSQIIYLSLSLPKAHAGHIGVRNPHLSFDWGNSVLIVFSKDTCSTCMCVCHFSYLGPCQFSLLESPGMNKQTFVQLVISYYFWHLKLEFDTNLPNKLTNLSPCNSAFYWLFHRLEVYVFWTKSQNWTAEALRNDQNYFSKTNKI